MLSYTEGNQCLDLGKYLSGWDSDLIVKMSFSRAYRDLDTTVGLE